MKKRTVIKTCHHHLRQQYSAPPSCENSGYRTLSRACERSVSVSGAENGAERAENRVERSVERTLQKNDGAERSAEREVAERERSGERAESATHSSLQPNISRPHNVYSPFTVCNAVCSFSLHALAFSLVQTRPTFYTCRLITQPRYFNKTQSMSST